MITEKEVKEKTPERFWSKIKFDDIDKCWLWTAYKNPYGYGGFGIQKDKKTVMKLASRLMYEWTHDSFDKKLDVLHNCPGKDNPSCVNPNHLWEGTHQDNMDDMTAKGRRHIPPPPIGSKNFNAKLNEEIVVEIKKQLANGELQREIAKRYGVERTQITAINSGKTWKHVSGVENKKPRFKVKLNGDIVLEIRKRLSLSDANQGLIAREFNISEPVISAIKHGRVWKDVVLQ